MPAANEGDSANQLFADLSLERGVLTARLMGPNIGEREGQVIAGMIEETLKGSEPVAWVVLDFSQVSFINSAGLGSCVVVHNRSKAGGATVVLYAMQANIRDIFKMTKLDKVFKVADDSNRLKKLLS
jgi:anti-anti-sigma factor